MANKQEYSPKISIDVLVHTSLHRWVKLFNSVVGDVATLDDKCKAFSFKVSNCRKRTELFMNSSFQHSKCSYKVITVPDICSSR